jgi:stearoyl-CoA desaturase (delta-9 desaturase)
MTDTVESVYPYRANYWWHKAIILTVALVPVGLLGLAVYTFWGANLTWWHLGVLLGGQTIAGIGISLGYHRMLAHGAFKASAPVRAVLLGMAITALQGGPASWAATHRRHHARADREGDPHSPLEGFWHAHFGWMVKGRFVESGPAHAKLMQDPIVRFYERTQGLWYIATFAVPGLIVGAALGGWTGFSWGGFWTGVLWGGVVRVMLVHHVTWSINSVCHVLGTRPYDSPDVARNNGLFGWIGWGEGWHNNHHAFPNSAYLGHRWWQVDVGKYVLLILRPLRLVRDVHVPSRAERAARRAGNRRTRTPLVAIGGKL